MAKTKGLSEREEQRALVAWFKWQYPNELLFAIPNQLVRGKLGALVACRDGVVAGVPDVMVACSRCGLHGLFIEMKSCEGRVSIEQARIGDLLCEKGYLAVVCYGFEEAKSVVSRYMADQWQV